MSPRLSVLVSVLVCLSSCLSASVCHGISVRVCPCLSVRVCLHLRLCVDCGQFGLLLLIPSCRRYFNVRSVSGPYYLLPFFYQMPKDLKMCVPLIILHAFHSFFEIQFQITFQVSSVKVQTVNTVKQIQPACVRDKRNITLPTLPRFSKDCTCRRPCP